MFGDHLAQRALRPLAGLDHVGDFAAQRGIVEHHQVDIEQRALFRAQLGRQLGGQGTHVGAHAFDGGLEQRQFGVDVDDGLVRHHVQIRRRQHDHRRTDRRARRTRHTDELGFLDALALPAQTTDRTGGLGVGNNAGELRAHGHEEGFFAFVELTAFFLLDDQHADDAAVVNDRRAEERGVALLAGFGEVAIARVIRGVFEVQGSSRVPTRPTRPSLGAMLTLPIERLFKPSVAISTKRLVRDQADRPSRPGCPWPL